METQRTPEEKAILEDIQNIERELYQIRKPFIETDRQKPSKKEVLRLLIHQELGELATLIRMLAQVFDRLHEIDIKDGTKYEEHFFLTAQLKVLVKALYEWLNHVKELVDSNSEIKKLLPKEIYERLKAHCEFRHKLVTHKQGLKIYSMSAIRFDPKKFKAEIMMTPMSIPDEISKDLDELFARCAKQSNGKIDPNEKNFHERCMLICRNLDALSGRERKEAVSFIEKYGAVSSDAAQLVHFISELTVTLIPKL